MIAITFEFKNANIVISTKHKVQQRLMGIFVLPALHEKLGDHHSYYNSS